LEEQAESVAFEGAPTQNQVQSRRSYLEIQMDILRAVRNGAKAPTQIMYKANLAWTALQDSLRKLTETGFIARKATGSRKRYEITVKGLGTLTSYDKILESVRLPGRTSEPQAW
jgi:predicted transcriptional regulator